MANQSIYAAFERMWQHLSDRLEEYKPEGLATEEYVDSKVANKVDKVDGKGLSDVNFTKEYEA